MTDAEVCSAPWINIAFPVRNEEGRIGEGIEKTVGFFEGSSFDDYVLTVVDNDSADATFAIAERLAEEHPHVQCMRIEKKGVGAAFRAAIETNESPIVGYMDVDLATDLHHLSDVIRLFEDAPALQFINGSRWANGYGSTGRGLKRTITSMGLTGVLKASLHMRASDAICGFKFFRKETAERLASLADSRENGWFFIIEMLLIAERTNVNMEELPVVWVDDGNSSVDIGPVIHNYLIQIKRLRKRMRMNESDYIRIA